jgi:Inositol polyphosphate kinase
MSLSKHDHRIQPMIGQVGGLGLNRKPILTLVPDYLLKPLVLDHRGLREIAFYEAIRTVISQSQPKQEIQYHYNNFLTGREHQQQQISPKSTMIPSDTTKNNFSYYRTLISNIRNTVSSILTPILKSIDTIAMAFALTYIQDPYVLESEKILHETWQNIQNEIDMIRQLNKFTPPYYGVIVIATPPLPSETTTTPTPTVTPPLPSDVYGTPAPTKDATSPTTALASTEVQTPASASQQTQATVTSIPPAISDLTTVNTNAIMDSNDFWKQLEDSHLLLQDLTINYSKPCVMDLKMGVQTYVR